MSKKVAVILSGCGFKDGGEIYEATLTLLALDEADADEAGLHEGLSSRLGLWLDLHALPWRNPQAVERWLVSAVRRGGRGFHHLALGEKRRAR